MWSRWDFIANVKRTMSFIAPFVLHIWKRKNGRNMRQAMHLLNCDSEILTCSPCAVVPRRAGVTLFWRNQMNFVRVGSGKTRKLVRCYRAVGAIVAWNAIIVFKSYSYCFFWKRWETYFRIKIRKFFGRLVWYQPLRFNRTNLYLRCMSQSHCAVLFVDRPNLHRNVDSLWDVQSFHPGCKFLDRKVWEKCGVPLLNHMGSSDQQGNLHIVNHLEMSMNFTVHLCRNGRYKLFVTCLIEWGIWSCSKCELVLLCKFMSGLYVPIGHEFWKPVLCPPVHQNPAGQSSGSIEASGQK